MQTAAPRRRALAVAALAPLASLLGSRLLTMAIAFGGLGRVLPPGIHSYQPAVNLLGVNLLMGLCTLPALGGIAVLGWRRPAPGTRPLSLAHGAGILAAAEVVFYLLQAALVAQLQGIPDGWGVFTLAVLLQLALVGSGYGLARARRHIVPAAFALALPAAVPVDPPEATRAELRTVLLAGIPRADGTSRRGPPCTVLATA